jgi:hypothetical protein
VFNVLHGFEGELDDVHHRGSMNGWRHRGAAVGAVLTPSREAEAQAPKAQASSQFFAAGIQAAPPARSRPDSWP